jgi:hypothetical protein
MVRFCGSMASLHGSKLSLHGSEASSLFFLMRIRIQLQFEADPDPTSQNWCGSASETTTLFKLLKNTYLYHAMEGQRLLRPVHINKAQSVKVPPMPITIDSQPQRNRKGGSIVIGQKIIHRPHFHCNPSRRRFRAPGKESAQIEHSHPVGITIFDYCHR